MKAYRDMTFFIVMFAAFLLIAVTFGHAGDKGHNGHGNGQDASQPLDGDGPGNSENAGHGTGTALSAGGEVNGRPQDPDYMGMNGIGVDSQGYGAGGNPSGGK